MCAGRVLHLSKDMFDISVGSERKWRFDISSDAKFVPCFGVEAGPSTCAHGKQAEIWQRRLEERLCWLT